HHGAGVVSKHRLAQKKLAGWRSLYRLWKAQYLQQPALHDASGDGNIQARQPPTGQPQLAARIQHYRETTQVRARQQGYPKTAGSPPRKHRHTAQRNTTRLHRAAAPPHAVAPGVGSHSFPARQQRTNPGYPPFKISRLIFYPTKATQKQAAQSAEVQGPSVRYSGRYVQYLLPRATPISPHQCPETGSQRNPSRYRVW